MRFAKKDEIHVEGEVGELSREKTGSSLAKYHDPLHQFIADCPSLIGLFFGTLGKCERPWDVQGRPQHDRRSIAKYLPSGENFVYWVFYHHLATLTP